MSKEERIEKEKNIFSSLFEVISSGDNSFCFFDKKNSKKSDKFSSMEEAFFILDNWYKQKVINFGQKLNFTALLVRLPIPHILVKEQDRRTSILMRWSGVNLRLSKILENKPKKRRNPYEL